MGVILKNNSVSTITTAISASDVGLAVAAGTGSLFPALGAEDYFYATLVSTSGENEIVKVTARVSDTMTIVRAQEGSTAQSFAAGSRIESRVTAASVVDTVQDGLVPLQEDINTLQGEVLTLENALGGGAFSNTYASTTAGLSSGVISTAAIVAGSGGTNGTFDVAFSGGSGTGAAARFTVSGGALVSIVITNPGTGYTSAPTLSFAASSGLSGASATAVIGARQPVGSYFYVPGTGENSLLLYRVDAGPAATLVSTQPSSTAITVRAGTDSGWLDPFFKVYTIGQTFLGRERWFSTTTNNTLVSGTVFPGGRALRRTAPVGADLGGPRVWLDEINAVAGDTITFRAIMTAAAGVIGFFGVRFLNAAGSNITTQETATPNATSSTPTLVSLTTTVPVDAVSARVYFANSGGSGSGNFDCHAFWVCKGAAATVPEWPTFGADLVGSELAQNIQYVQLPSLVSRVGLLESTDAYAFQTYGSVTPEPEPADVTLAVSSVIASSAYGSPFRGWGERYVPGGVSFNALRFRSIGRTSSVGEADYWRTLQVVVRSSSGGNSSQSGSTLIAVGQTLVQPNQPVLEDIVVILRDPITNAVKTLTDADLGTEYFIGTYMLDTGGGTAFCSPHRGTMTNPLGSPQSYYITTANPQTGNWSTFTGNWRLGCDHLLLASPQDVTVYAPTQQLINDIASGGDTSGTPNSYDTEALRQYAKRITAGEAITVAFLGDSWTNTAYRLFTPMRNYFSASLGISAPGYTSANTALSAPTNITRARTGTWTDVRSATTAVGPDNSHASTTDTSATLTFTSATTVGQWYIHYLRQPGGGSFTYAVGGGSATTVNTDGALAYQVVNVSGPGALVLAVTVANTAGVLIAGAEARNTTTGQVIMHKLGSGGAQASHFAGMGTGYLETAYQSLAPDVVVICLGTNDHAASVGLSTFRTNIATIVDRVRANVPLADILLLGPGPNNTSAAYPITDYITQLYDLAVELDCGFVDLMSGFGTYTEANARGLFEDAVHPNTAGGLVIGRTIWRAMFTE